MSHPVGSWDGLVDLVGDEFVKLFVCTHNKWNPYSKEIKNIPPLYWSVAFSFIKMHSKQSWDEHYKPQAELIGQIANPEIYKIYADHVKETERIEESETKSGEYKTDIGDKTRVSATTDAHFDPAVGLVDGNGKLLIPKDKYEEMVGLDGVAISY